MTTTRLGASAAAEPAAIANNVVAPASQRRPGAAIQSDVSRPIATATNGCIRARSAGPHNDPGREWTGLRWPTDCVEKYWKHIEVKSFPPFPSLSVFQPRTCQ